jgi:hypothetical protein
MVKEYVFKELKPEEKEQLVDLISKVFTLYQKRMRGDLGSFLKDADDQISKMAQEIEALRPFEVVEK